MKKIFRVVSKSQRNVIGILSGTSIDAVDVVLTRIKGSGKSTKITIIDFQSNPISRKTKELILKCSDVKRSRVDEICSLNPVIGNLFANAILKIIKKNNLRNKDIDLIGSHGQTIYHIPKNRSSHKRSLPSTMQSGDPSVIAYKTGILTVGDFRSSDIAAGGDGAPLVPYLDFALFSHQSKNRLLVNIGGISNITFLKKNSKKENVIAFDCGPGNMLIDSLMKNLFGKKFDRNGMIAKKGEVIDKLFSFLKSFDTYYKKEIPKSTGREYYGEKYISSILKFKKHKPEDIIRTVTEFTSFCIYYNYKKFITDKFPDEVLVSGGGCKNFVLMNSLKKYFKNSDVKILNESGITAENKEAVLFAFLANELFNDVKTNIKFVTGAAEETYLGKICIA
jgi:anhydro-N-acetylmuramic acid kinase